MKTWFTADTHFGHAKGGGHHAGTFGGQRRDLAQVVVEQRRVRRSARRLPERQGVPMFA